MARILLLLTALGFFLSGNAQSPPGNSFSFDGDRDYFTIPNTSKLNFTSAITMEAWVRRDGGGDWSNIVSKNTNDVLCLRRSGSSNRICFDAAGVEVTSTTQLAQGIWYHIAGVYNGTTVAIYVNGVAEDVKKATATTLTTGTDTYPYLVGGTTWGNRCWNGAIDEVRIWNIARTQTKLINDMYAPISASSTGLVAYYQFDQGTAGANNAGVTTLSDACASPADGSTSGSNIALTGSTSNWIESYAMVVPKVKAASNTTANGFTANWVAPVTGTTDNYLLDVSTNKAFSSFVTGYNGVSVPVGTTTYNVTGLTAGTVYYYRVRSNKSSVANQGGYSATASQTIVTPGNAFAFDGDNDYFIVPNSGKLNFVNAITVEAWVRMDGDGDWSHIVSKNTNDQLCLRRSGMSDKICFSVAGAEATSSTSLTRGVWYHVAGVFDGTNVRIFLNGVEEHAVAATSSTLDANTHDYYIGGTTWNNRCWNGAIDEVRIWNTALSGTTIRANMRNVVNPATSGLAAYFRFDEGLAFADNSGLSTLPDLTASPANGSSTASGIALAGATSNWTESYAMVVPVIDSSSVSYTVFNLHINPPPAGTVNNYYLDVSTNADFSTLLPKYNRMILTSSATLAVNDLMPATVYYVRVRANKYEGVMDQGAYSNILAITTKTPGTPPGGPYTQPGNAFSFDGDNDYFTIPNAAKLNFTTAITMEAWVRRDGSGDWSNIVSKNTNDVLCLRRSGSSNRICFDAAGVEVTSTTQLAQGIWYHIAGVYDGTNVTIYVNGVAEHTRTATAANLTTGSNTYPYYIGGTTWANRCWNGAVDEVRIWNVARTATEIQQNMNTQVSSSATGLVAYYTFDQGTASEYNNTYGSMTAVNTLTDITANPSNGTASSNTLLAENKSNWVESYAMVVPVALEPGAHSTTSFIARWQAPVTGTVNNYILDVSTSPTFATFVTGYNGLVVPAENLTQIVSGLNSATTYYYRVRANKTSVSSQGAYSVVSTVNTSVLPVSWGDFTVKPEGINVLLQWSTTAEQHSSHFVVQRSSDGNNWKNIGNTKAAGYSAILSTYSFTDMEPMEGVNIYRIAQVDVDGRTTYSVLRNVRIAEKKVEFELVANPVTSNTLPLNIYTEGYFYLINAEGKTIWRKKLGTGLHYIPVSGQAKGLYIIKSESQSKRFIIQ